MQDDGIKLHIGGATSKEGWRVLNIVPGPHVDYVGNCNDLSFLPDNACTEIYASHVLEHLGYNGEIAAALKGMHRVLKPGGRLRVSVPDLMTLCQLFVQPDMPTQARWELMRMMYGGRLDEHDVHTSGLTDKFLSILLRQAGFQRIARVGEFLEFHDTNLLRFAGQLISLNMEAFK